MELKLSYHKDHLKIMERRVELNLEAHDDMTRMLSRDFAAIKFYKTQIAKAESEGVEAFDSDIYGMISE